MRDTVIKEIIIDPRCKFNYASYYIYGLKNSGVNWHFKQITEFDGIMNQITDYNKGFGMCLIYQDNRRRKIFVDFSDSCSINENAYSWCDLYAVVNVKPKDLRDKIFPIGPNCGLRVYSLPRLLLIMLFNVIKSYSRKNLYKPGIKNIARDYLYTFYRRLDYSSYSKNIPIKEEYCFTISTLWYDDITDKETNSKRYQFVKACSENFEQFEGGFYYINGVEKEWKTYTTYLEKYKGLLYNKRVPMKEYIRKTKQSTVVFNTPSVSLCLGWKLAEYLIMGKAIISTEIQNVMPGNFSAGEHYLLANNENEIVESIKKIKDNRDLREKLEMNSKEYFSSYTSPTKVIERIISKLENI